LGRSILSGPDMGKAQRRRPEKSIVYLTLIISLSAKHTGPKPLEIVYAEIVPAGKWAAPAHQRRSCPPSWRPHLTAHLFNFIGVFFRKECFLKNLIH